MKTLIMISAEVADDINFKNLVCHSDCRGGVCIAASSADAEISNAKIVNVQIDPVAYWLRIASLPYGKIKSEEMRELYLQYGPFMAEGKIPRRQADMVERIKKLYGSYVSLESWVKSWVNECCAYLEGNDEEVIRSTALLDVFYDMKCDVENGPYDTHLKDEYDDFDDWYDEVFFRRVAPLLALQGFDTSDEDNEELRDAIILWARNMYPLVNDEEHTEYIDGANHRTFIYNKVSDNSILVER